jgi:hypothetical protein
MTDNLLSQSGPEGRNQDAAAFEDQLAAMGRDLGWDLVFRNIDFQLARTHAQAATRGVDVLWSVADPRDGKNYGWLEEAKRHDGMGRYSQQSVHEEVHTLASKVTRAANLQAFREHRETKSRRLQLIGGMLAHRTPAFDPATMATRLQDLQLAGKQGGVSPVRVVFYGPDTLNALAEALDRHGKPQSFCWPPTLKASAAWGPACPPEQLALGMLAWKTAEGQTVLWLRQDLQHQDLDAIAEVAYAWGIDPDHVLFSELTQEQWRLVADGWRELARVTRGRPTGRLPDAAAALDVTLARLNCFDKVWQVAA